MSVAIDPNALSALLTRARREVDDGLLPSCQVAVARDGELVALETIGEATDASRYVIFSLLEGAHRRGDVAAAGRQVAPLDQRGRA
jgi:hypothetical protein